MQHPKLIPWIAKLTFLAVIIALIAAPYIFTPYTTAAQDSGRVELVPNDWSLKPADIGPGERFRLIFLSSTKRNATSSNIDTYNSFVQNLAANGHVAIQNYSSRFRVVGCTTTVDARDNTRTTPIGNAATIKKGVPIYWLGGNKVADDYTDFYDSTWDDEANDKNESGNDAHDTSQSNNFPFTGCDAGGTEARDGAASLALSSSTGVVVGQLNSTINGAAPLSSLSDVTRTNSRPFYALSPVFEVHVTNKYGLFPNGAPYPGRIDSDESTGIEHAVRLHKNVPYRIEVKGSERSQPGGTINNPRIKIFAGRDELTLLNTSADGVSQTSSMTKARGGGATSTSGTNSRLEIKPDETDRYRLQVYGAAGDNGTYTITINALDRPQGRLASDITVDQENRNSVSISWTKSKKTQSYLRYPKTTYETFYRTWPDGEWVFGGGRISDPRTYTFTGLTPGTSYEVRVHMVPPPGLTTHINQWGYARVYTAN